MQKKYTFLSVLFLTLLAFFIRIYGLSAHPPLDVDEYSVGYNAFSIATTGKDEWGMVLPLFFRAFGDYKLGFDIYLSAFFFLVFQANSFWLRFPQAIIGALYVPLIFLLLRLFIKDKKLVFLGTILAVFSPYGIYFSRISSGSISQAFLTLASITCFAYFVQNKQRSLLIGSILLLSLSLYAYPSAWLVAPILILGYGGITIWKKRYSDLAFFSIFFLALIPIFLQFYQGGSEVRLANTSFFGQNKGAILEVNEFRAHVNNDFLSKLFHNKIVYYAYVFVFNYVKHFDPQFLILMSQNLIIQHSLYPPLFLVLLPFYYIGLVYLFKNYKNPLHIIVLLWIFASPFPSAVTEGAVNTKRYLTFLGSDIIVVILGMYAVEISKYKKLFLSILIILSLQIVHFIYFFFISYPLVARGYTHFKGNTLVQIIQENYSKTDIFIYTADALGEPQIFPLFGVLYPAEKYMSEKKSTFTGWYYIQPFGKFHFVNNIEDLKKAIVDNEKKNALVFISENELIQSKKNLCYKILKTYAKDKEQIIIDPNNTFHLIKFTPCQ